MGFFTSLSCDDAFCARSGQPHVPAGGPKRGGHELGHNHVLPGISSPESQTIRTIRTLVLPWKIVATKPNDSKPEICGEKMSALTCQIKFEPSCCKGLHNCCATGRAPCMMTCCGFCFVVQDMMEPRLTSFTQGGEGLPLGFLVKFLDEGGFYTSSWGDYSRAGLLVREGWSTRCGLYPNPSINRAVPSFLAVSEQPNPFPRDRNNPPMTEPSYLF